MNREERLGIFADLLREEGWVEASAAATDRRIMSAWELAEERVTGDVEALDAANLKDTYKRGIDAWDGAYMPPASYSSGMITVSVEFRVDERTTVHLSASAERGALGNIGDPVPVQWALTHDVRRMLKALIANLPRAEKPAVASAPPVPPAPDSGAMHKQPPMMRIEETLSIVVGPGKSGKGTYRRIKLTGGLSQFGVTVWEEVLKRDAPSYLSLGLGEYEMTGYRATIELNADMKPVKITKLEKA